MARGKPRGAGPTREGHLRDAKLAREKVAKKKTTKKKPAKKKATKKVPARIPLTGNTLKVKTKRERRPLSKTQEAKLEELKIQIEPTLREMVRAGKYMVAFWWSFGTHMPMRRITNAFPTGSFDNAVDTLDENLREARRKLLQEEFNVEAEGEA